MPRCKKKRNNKVIPVPWKLLTKKIPGTQDYKLISRRSTQSDFVDYFAYLEYQDALRKLGRIEEFESQVKMDILDYVACRHEEKLEYSKMRTPRKALETDAGPMCPNHCNVVLNTAMKYCPECGQAVIVGRVYENG